MYGAAVVVGVGESRYYRRGGATESEFQLACIAIRNPASSTALRMAVHASWNSDSVAPPRR